MSILFGCGHANSPGNRYCNVCGASRNLPCASCGATNPDEAAFCGNCGIRLAHEGARRESAEPTRLLRAGAVRESSQSPGPPRVPSLEPGRPLPRDEAGRVYGDLNDAARVYGDPDDFIDDEEEERERRHRRRKRVTMTVLAVAILLIVCALALGRLAATREKAAGRPESGAVAEQRSAPPSPDSDRAVAAPSTASRAEAPLEGPRPTANESAAHGSSPAQPQPTRTPATDRSQPSSPPPAAHATEAPPASSSEENSQVTLPPSPARRRNTGDAADQGLAQASAPSSASSEERVAGFLVGELGPTRAEERALANAAWYGSDREEYSYWRRVAKLIKQGEGR